MLALMAARIATPHSQRENATLIPSGVRTQAASHPSGCKDSANRTKNQIYLDFSEMQPLQRHTLREFFLGKKIVNILHKMKKYTKNFGNLRNNTYLWNSKYLEDSNIVTCPSPSAYGSRTSRSPHCNCSALLTVAASFIRDFLVIIKYC